MCLILAANASALSASCMSPPSPTTSGRAVAFEHTTGQPAAIASRGGKPNPSSFEGNRSASAMVYNSLILSSGILPRNFTLFRRLSWSIRCKVFALPDRSPGSPIFSKSTSGYCFLRIAIVFKTVLRFLRGCSEPTCIMSGVRL